MVFRGELDRRLALLSVKNASVSLAIGADWVAAWDLGGRLYSLWKAGCLSRRGLNGRMLRKGREELGIQSSESRIQNSESRRGNPQHGRQRVHLDGGEAVAAIVHDPFSWPSRDGRHPDGPVLALVERCARFDAEAAREDAARFARIFRPVGILPPDQYLSIVLQATEGCSFGTCTFCDLYHDRYRVKSAEEFRQHAEDVRGYLGESARLRARSVFLGAANALAVPMPRLVEFLETAASVFAAHAGPVHAFVDGFTGARKSAGDYARLREKGLRRVYIGLESGHDALLAFVRKPATRDLAVEAVRAIKGGGVSVGIIVMIGLGGRRFAAGHVSDTIAAVNAMGLGPADFLYFSDLVEVPGTSYPGQAASEDVQPLSAAERLAQLDAIRAGLAFAGPPPRLARYDVEEFVY
jgi:hypothetical protein